MKHINYRFSLDMFDTSSQIAIKAKKGDSACRICITLTESGKIYKIADGCYATFSARKADGTFIFDKCTIEDNTIVYDFMSSVTEDGTCQISACEGAVGCEVTLYKADSEKLTSPRFTLVIGSTIYNGEEIVSSSEANALREFVDEIAADVVEKALGNLEVENEYDPTSTNAQSGKAVAEAVSGIPISQAKRIDKITPCLETGMYYIKGYDVTCETELTYTDEDFCWAETGERLQMATFCHEEETMMITESGKPIFRITIDLSEEGANTYPYADTGFYAVYDRGDMYYTVVKEVATEIEKPCKSEIVCETVSDEETVWYIWISRPKLWEVSGNEITDYINQIFDSKITILGNGNYISSGLGYRNLAEFRCRYNGLSGFATFGLEVESVHRDYVDTAIGSIETALDSIIAIQETLIGGGE